MRQRLNAPDVWANPSPQSLTDPEAKGWGDCRQGGFSGDPLENLCREGWALEMCKQACGGRTVRLEYYNIRDLVIVAAVRPFGPTWCRIGMPLGATASSSPLAKIWAEQGGRLVLAKQPSGSEALKLKQMTERTP